MSHIHISNLFALAKGLRSAFFQCQSHRTEHVLRNNAHLLTYYYQSHAKDWEKLIRPNPSHYQKKWLSLDNVPLDMKPDEQLPFGIAILTWMPGQMTNIHGHPENGCIMMPLRGTLTEERYINPLTLTECVTPVALHWAGDSMTVQTVLPSLPNKYLSVQKNILIPGQTAFINNKMGVHQIKNNGDTLAVSLHVYSPGPC
jgi:predicted metal-dependent enzyme (double-stranded beta helix superfamily)